MGVNPATFSSAGQISQHYIPGAYSRNNFVANEGGGVSTGNICIFGDSELGKPQVLQVFSSANEARDALLSGGGLEGVVQAFAPGNDLTPQQVGFMRVNDGNQSARTLAKTATDIFSVKSFSYGVPMNQIRLKFSAATIDGSRIQIEYKGNTEDFDNIKRESLQVHYIGAGSAGTLSINATHLTTSITGAASDDLNLALADYPTISELAEFINNQAGYTAAVLTGIPTQKSTVLDFETAIDIKTAAKNLTSNYEAVYDTLNTATLITDVVKASTTRSLPDIDVDYVYLSGGTYGSYTTAEFTSALAVAETEDIQLISTVSTDAAVHTLIKNHCVTMNSVEGRNERQFYVGGATGEDVSAVIARAATLNSSYGSLCSPGFYNYDDEGNEKLYSPAYYACKQVGMVSAQALNNPTTSKSVNILRWEKDYSRTNKNDLIKGGVLVGAKDQDNVYITVRSLTTFQGSVLQQNEASIMRETLYQAADLRKRQEKALIGTPNVGDDQLAIVDTVFERAIADWKGLGIIVADNGVLYTGYTRRIVGDQIVVDYNTWNTAPTNFVFTTHNISLLVQQ